MAQMEALRAPFCASRFDIYGKLTLLLGCDDSAPAADEIAMAEVGRD
jgi:hypothetical protein